MEQKRRKKLEDRKRKIEWRVWKKMVTFLQSHTLSELGFCNFFFFNKCCFSCGRKWV